MQRPTCLTHRHTTCFAAITLLAVTGCLSESTGPITSLPRALTSDEVHLIQVGNAHALRLLHAVNQEAPLSNVILSPLSTAMSLAMLYNGADGTTSEAIATVLGLDRLTLAEVNTAYRDLTSLVLQLDPTVRTALANALLYRSDRPLSSQYVDNLKEFYNADVLPIDFREPTAQQSINDWVATATEGAITEIAPPTFALSEVLMSLNAVHFDADWTYAFDPSATRLRPFHTAQGTRKMVPSMSHATWEDLSFYRASVDDPIIAVELPYGREAFSMTILQPEPGADFQAFAAGLDAAKWNAIVTGFEEGRVAVTMPLFTMATPLDLRSALTAMGMGVAFDSSQADFSRLRSNNDVFLSGARHAAVIEVDESGTTASAATSVTGGEVTSLDRYSFVVDRPFLFVIRDRLTGTILFIGAVVDFP